MIAVPDDAQPFKGEKFVDLFDVARSGSNQRRLAACGDHFCFFAHHFFHAIEDAVDQIGEAVKESGLQGGSGIRADDFPRVFNFNAEKDEPRG